MRINDLKDKKIAIWGFGIEGKAVLSILNKTFPEKKIIIIDDKINSIEEIKEILKNTDIVIRSPGVSIYKNEILEAKKNGVLFITEKTLFYGEMDNEKVITIGITGTKGKTTTSTFCAYILKKIGYKVILTGNIGIPTIDLIDEAKKNNFVITELSSYQTSDLLSFPKIAVVLNLFPEHLQWHLTHENYYKDKINVLNGAKYSIINPDNKKLVEQTKNIDIIKNLITYKDGYFFDENKKLWSTKNMKLLGEHNYQNLCSVLTILKLLNIDFLDIKQEYFDNFEPIKHRLEIIKKEGIIFVNDSISTIPEATIACYKIFKEKKIYGILGGYDRKQNYNELVDYIILSKNVEFLSLLGQTSKRIAETLKKRNFSNFKICNNLEECIKTLKEKITINKESVIILSPASPSYDMFKNFEERGEQFLDLI